MPYSKELHQFSHSNGIEGLTEASLQSLMLHEAGYDIKKAKQFLRFQKRINQELLQHRVITDNKFCHWFERGEQSNEQIKAFVVQFSVFSNLFLFAQLRKMINADSLEGMRASKEILANEIGVIFNSGKDETTEDGIVATEGTVQNGRFRFQAAHFEWLLKMADKLGLGFNDVGKARHGIPSTIFFCDELSRLYGSEDYMTSQAASYAVENWAAAGFWDQLVTGFEKFNKTNGEKLPLGFFSWHARIEAQHAAHTQEELEELYFSRSLDEDAFIKRGNEMLEGVTAFWDGLEELRQQLAHH